MKRKLLVLFAVKALLLSAPVSWSWGGQFGGHALDRNCATVTRVWYRVHLKQGDEYIDVLSPRFEGDKFVFNQYGGEVKMAADNVLRIATGDNETFTAKDQKRRAEVRAQSTKDLWFMTHGRTASYFHESHLNAVYALNEFVKACPASSAE